ncbi:general stress protein [Paenibacillus filicis]|uniref:General stress protein n=1 Tax=Paenibacillus gyeongsangnamensis TaxID=3388067 RepID=A0ABT4QHM7_9BACL|nr:general stress protein [Paenibacillus filicis]MCZ8516205.1 general stress protein [Paenibacillus filicis]
MKPQRMHIRLVHNEEQALRAIRSFREEGHSLNEIYVLAHDGERTEGLSKLTDTKTIGMMEEDMAKAFANLFRSRGDQIPGYDAVVRHFGGGCGYLRTGAG